MKNPPFTAANHRLCPLARQTETRNMSLHRGGLGSCLSGRGAVVGDSPYRGMQHSDLRNLIREYKKRIKTFKHEQEMIGWRNMDSEAWQAEEENIAGDQAQIDEIEAEIHRQTEVRNRREEAQENQRNLAGTPRHDSGPKPFDTALSAWFRSQRYEPAKHFEISWQLDGRRFVANWTAAPKRLEVWMVVQPGTPGATQRDGQHLMPCNNFEEQKAGRIAESHRPNTASPPRKTGPRRAEG